jgi:hypothetical protein
LKAASTPQELQLAMENLSKAIDGTASSSDVNITNII